MTLYIQNAFKKNIRKEWHSAKNFVCIEPIHADCAQLAHNTGHRQVYTGCSPGFFLFSNNNKKCIQWFWAIIYTLVPGTPAHLCNNKSEFNSNIIIIVSGCLFVVARISTASCHRKQQIQHKIPKKACTYNTTIRYESNW